MTTTAIQVADVMPSTLVRARSAHVLGRGPQDGAVAHDVADAEDDERHRQRGDEGVDLHDGHDGAVEDADDAGRTRGPRSTPSGMEPVAFSTHSATSGAAT